MANKEKKEILCQELLLDLSFCSKCFISILAQLQPPAFRYQESYVICISSDNYMITSYSSHGGGETSSNVPKFFARAPQERRGQWLYCQLESPLPKPFSKWKIHANSRSEAILLMPISF